MGRMKDYYADEIEKSRVMDAVECIPEGYAEYQFLAAFDVLCKQYGGFGKGKDKAFELIREQSLQ